MAGAAESSSGGFAIDGRVGALIRHSSEIVLVIDGEGFVKYVSPSAARISGYRPEELVGTRLRELLHPDDRDELLESIAGQLVHPGAHAAVELRARFADGSWRWIKETITDLRDDPDVAGLVLNIDDVSDERAAREALRESEERYRTIVETAQEGIWIMDLDGRVLFANPMMAIILGHETPDQVIGRSIFELLAGDDRDNARDNLEERRAGRAATYERQITLADGRRVWTRVTGSPLRDAAGNVIGTLALVSDITGRRQAEDALRHHAFHDHLTGLPNRAWLSDALPQIFAGGRLGNPEPYALLLIDLDHFKDINDSLGHDAGDQLLVEFAARLRAATRAVDSVMRLGGDEFAVVAPGVNTPADAASVAAHLLDIVAEPFEVAGMQVTMGLSIGVVHAPTHGQDGKDLFRHAEVAMYEAKRADGNSWAIYDATVEPDRPARLALTVALRQAIATGQLVLHYQPQVELATGRVIAAEALARWPHPQRGMIPPAEFVPLAEHSGLARPLAVWALQTALHQCARWRSEGIDLPVAVNISAAALRDASLYSAITEAIALAGVPARCLTVEITEASLAEPTPTLLQSLGDLRQLGVRISIDDFGTGYSALSYLKHLPIDELKIDRSFVMAILEDHRDRQIVEAVVTLAHSLGLHVVAEGIESPEVGAILGRLGCIGQGYAICRPAPAADITAWRLNQPDATPACHRV